MSVWKIMIRKYKYQNLRYIITGEQMAKKHLSKKEKQDLKKFIFKRKESSQFCAKLH